MEEKPKPDAEVYVLQQIREPYRPPRPYHLANQPELIDPLVNPQQVVLLWNGEVVAQCDCPAPLDVTVWQQVMVFLRTAAGLQTGTLQKVQDRAVGIMWHGRLRCSVNVPESGDDYHSWQHVLGELRRGRAVLEGSSS